MLAWKAVSVEGMVWVAAFRTEGQAGFSEPHWGLRQ